MASLNHKMSKENSIKNEVRAQKELEFWGQF